MRYGNGYDRSMLGTIFALAWPTMLEQLTQTAVQYIDTAMVGTLGTQATAAVGATGTVNWLIGSIVSAVGIGFLAFIARQIGAGNRERARQASAQACSVTLALGLVLTAVLLLNAKRIPVWMQVDPAIRDMAARYFTIIYLPMLFRTASILLGTVLRSAGDTRTPMRIGLVVNGMNMLLNFLLIFPTRTVSIFSTEILLPGAGRRRGRLGQRGGFCLWRRGNDPGALEASGHFPQGTAVQTQAGDSPALFPGCPAEPGAAVRDFFRVCGIRFHDQQPGRNIHGGPYDRQYGGKPVLYSRMGDADGGGHAERKRLRRQGP